jgi:hypothetical protein
MRTTGHAGRSASRGALRREAAGPVGLSATELSWWGRWPTFL